MRTTHEIVSDLDVFQLETSPDERLYELAEELEEHPDGQAIVPAVFRLFERYPDGDFGMPGPLAHAAEKFYRNGYEDGLAASLERNPTSLTVWLANRIANAGDENSSRFIELLNEIAMRPKVADDVRSEALHFADLHR